MRQLSKKTKCLLFQTTGANSGGKYRVLELVDNIAIKHYLEHCGFRNVIHLCDTRKHGGIRGLFIAKGAI